ncbi:hypothetical protein Ancab_030231 [Ancistrocladus abbreviatus]
MASFNDSTWDLLDYSFIDDGSSSDFCWLNQRSMESLKQECLEKQCTRKRGRLDSCSKAGNKACREKLRREKLNDSFSDLSSVLETGRTVKMDKLLILGDAIKVLSQLKTEAEEFKVENERLQEEIRSLKAEKNELRKEKLMLKAEKEKMEQQLKALTVANPGFMPPPLAAYQAGVNKMAVFPGYGVYPMWHYLPPSTHDTSHDHELRPPAA